MAKIRIIIADDHPLIRIGLKDLIGRDSALTVSAEAADGEELLDVLSRRPCDVILMDISMPRMDGLAALGAVSRHYPDIKVLVLSIFKDYAHFHAVMNLGAAGYMTKDDAPEQLIPAIKQIVKGRKYVSSSVTALLVERELRPAESAENPSLEILSRREKQILSRIAAGLSNKIIASELNLSVRTVEHHRAHLTAKLGFKDTASLVKYALAKNLA